MHRYNIDRKALSWLKVDLHIIVLFEEGAPMTRYLTLISPENPTNDPSKALRLFKSRRSLLKES